MTATFRTAQTTLATAAALFSGALGTFVLISPREWRGEFNASGRQMESWLDTLPTAVAIGTVVAVLAYAALQRAGSVRPAWISGVVASAVLIAVRLSVSGAGGVDQLTLLHYTKCVAAGVLLGAAVAAAWARPLPRFALVVGVAATFVVAHTARADWTPSTSALGEPFWWVLVPTLVLAAVCAVVDADGPAESERDITLQAIAAVATLALAHRLLGAWIDGQTTNSRLQLWTVLAVGLVLVVALTEFWARRLDSPFLLAATAVAAATPFVTTLISRTVTQDYLREESWVLVVVGFAAVAASAAVARWRPAPVLGLAVLALIPLSAVIDPSPGNGRVWVLVPLAVLGVGIGVALGSTLPDSGALASLGLVVPLLSLVFAEVVGVTSRFVFYSGSYEPLPDVPPSEGWTAISFDSPVTFDRGAAVAMLLVVVFCALAIRGHRAQPSVPRPE
ncbi:Integral membrane protein [Prescottella defluvii]|uniref:hypothetical protein n=1 Tax=Prescottella defluvii TaxID=1323361 RepID=UPI0004F3B874|nr:hypothetical protein [Prescottella defluvii]